MIKHRVDAKSFLLQTAFALLFWSAIAAQAAPRIDQFAPRSGSAGTSVKITGEGIETATLVLFNGVPAQFQIEAASGAVVAIVPKGAVTGRILIVTPTGNAVSAGSFFIDSPFPNIESFTPEGPVGANVIIGLNVALPVNRVVFNGTEASFTPIFERYLLAQVPVGVVSGPISIEFDGGSATSADPFVVTQPPGSNVPVISGFSPSSGAVGRRVLVSGLNLTKDPLTVLFGSVVAQFQSTESGLLVTVPANAMSGSITVVTLWGFYVTTESFVVIPPPKIDRFDPAIGPVGSTVQVFGTGILNAEEVTISGVKAAFRSDPVSGSLIINVPADATTGKIAVRTPNGTTVSSDDFKVVRISSFTPKANVGGYVIVVVNSEGPVFGVEFNGIKAGSYQIRAGTNLLLLIKVPEGATRGPITLDLNLFRVTSPGDFTPTQEPVEGLPKIATVSPATGLVGSQLIVTGSDLTNSILAVQVAGRLAEFVPTAEGLLVTVPSGALRGSVTVITLQGVAVATDVFAVTPYSVRGDQPVCFAWDPNQDTLTIGYTLYILDHQGSIFYREKIPGNNSQKTCVTLDLSSVPLPNGRYTALMTAYDKEGIESYPSGRILFEVVPSLETISSDAGRVGDAITITGRGLGEVTGVSLGGVPAFFRVIDSQTVEVMVSNETLSGPLLVTTRNGSLLAASQFFVTSDFDLTLTVNSAPENVIQGREFASEYRIQNRGPDTAHDVTFSLNLPSELDLESLKINGTETLPLVPERVWHFNSVARGESITIGAVMKARWTGTASIHALVRADPPDVDRSNNVATSQVVIFPELRLTPRAGNEIGITWNGNGNEFILQFSEDVSSDGSWTNVSGAVIPEFGGPGTVVLPLSGKTGFFRLQHIYPW